jgi:hypothetical protein
LSLPVTFLLQVVRSLPGTLSEAVTVAKLSMQQLDPTTTTVMKKSAVAATDLCTQVETSLPLNKTVQPLIMIPSATVSKKCYQAPNQTAATGI